MAMVSISLQIFNNGRLHLLAEEHRRSSNQLELPDRCKDLKVHQRAFASVEQRWMFTDSNFTGPVTFFIKNKTEHGKDRKTYQIRGISRTKSLTRHATDIKLLFEDEEDPNDDVPHKET